MCSRGSYPIGLASRCTPMKRRHRWIAGFALRTLEFARTRGKECPEDQDVLVDDQVPGLAAGAGLADVVELEERRPGDQPPAAEPREQRDAPLGRDQPALAPAARTAPGRSTSSPRCRQGRAVTTTVPPGRSSILQPARIWVNPASRSSTP